MTLSPLETELRAAVFASACVGVLLAGAMLAPAAAEVMLGSEDWETFVVSAGLSAAVAVLTALVTRGASPRPTQRFGFLLVVMLWALVPLIGAIPFVMHGLTVTDAVFESVSGFTTTGSTVMVGLDRESPGILLWRSLAQWLGGVGILALGLILLPFLRIGGMQLFSKESSDRSERPVPRFAAFARSLFVVYLVLTAACVVAYEAVGMSAFDALNHAMTTLSTGGFSTSDASFGQFKTDGPLWVGTIFMALGGLPFALYIALLARRRTRGLDPQVPVFFALLLLGGLGFAFEQGYYPGEHGFAEAMFNATSIITTTGFASSDYAAWGPFTVALAFVLTFLGGCAGSTSGGVKTYRLIVTWTMLRRHLAQLVHPNASTPIRYGGRPVDPVVFRSALVFLIAFIVALTAATLALAAAGLDLVTALSGALTALTNVGPGLGPIIGPAGNFSTLPDVAKWLLCLAMLLGRLEILPVLALLAPEFWRW